jgi:hypothetical protein
MRGQVLGAPWHHCVEQEQNFCPWSKLRTKVVDSSFVFSRFSFLNLADASHRIRTKFRPPERNQQSRNLAAAGLRNVLPTLHQTSVHILQTTVFLLNSAAHLQACFPTASFCTLCFYSYSAERPRTHRGRARRQQRPYVVVRVDRGDPPGAVRPRKQREADGRRPGENP